MKKSGISKLLFLFAFVIVLAGCDILNKEEIEDKYLVSFAKQGSYFPALIKEFYANIDDDYPEVKPIADAVEHSVQVYTITYKTTFDGEEIIASGLVSVPVSSGSYPIISFQNGTNTLNSEAPSVNPDAALFRLLETIASTGFIVSVPDYLGFGESSSMFHPYLDKESTVQAVTDMLRAVGELVDNHLKVKKNNDLYIMGYSQGGWATMTLQKAIETEMAGEFNLKASACGAGPYDLNLVNDYVLSQTNYPMPYYIGYIFNSYIKLGDITNTPSDVFKAPYADRVLTLYDGTKSGEEINAQLTTKTADLYTSEFLSGYKTNPKFSTVVSSLQKNSVTAWKTNIPTLLLHGSADNYVPPTTSENLFAAFKSQGVSTSVVNYVPIPGAGHSSGVIPACTAAIKWFIDLKAAN